MSTWTESEHDRDQAGKFTEMAGSEQTDALTVNLLASQDPRGIDGQLADIHDREWGVRYEIGARRESIARHQKYLSKGNLLVSTAANREQAMARCVAEIEELEGVLAELAEQRAPFEAEYRRRGTWTRAFLVTGGHLHRSMHCSTCNRDGKLTRFAWMTDYSGASEAEIVEAAGERACTTCYPSAPVDVLSRPSTMLTPDERQAAAGRALRQQEKARKTAEREAKAINNPDGSPLRHGHLEARTLVTAERELTDALLHQIVDRRTPYANRGWASENAELTNMLVRAIAAKKGTSEQEVREAAQQKAERKFKREWGA
ncbi:hypothetical protein [Microbacterium enclense]|uniref:hypothetical protein n=1 Tax=Microbacterium enclense TaxID=993073 RepID=UPI003F7DA188